MTSMHSSPIVGETRPSKSFSMVTMSLCARCIPSQAHKAHPCLWCLMPQRDMHQPSDQCQSRSLETLLTDNSAFLRETSDKREVAKFHNALHASLLEIDLESLSPPYLHILLGVVLKHHKLLEDSAHRLDVEIVGENDEVLTNFGKNVKQYLV